MVYITRISFLNVKLVWTKIINISVICTFYLEKKEDFLSLINLLKGGLKSYYEKCSISIYRNNNKHILSPIAKFLAKYVSISEYPVLYRKKILTKQLMLICWTKPQCRGIKINPQTTKKKSIKFTSHNEITIKDANETMRELLVWCSHTIFQQQQNPNAIRRRRVVPCHSSPLIPMTTNLSEYFRP